MSSKRKRQITIGFWLLVGVGALIGGIVAGDPVLGGAVLAFYVSASAVFIIGERRGWAFTALASGIGDERIRSVYRQANSRTMDMLGAVLGVWLIGGMIRDGEVTDTLFAICCLYVVLWTLNITWSVYAAWKVTDAANRAELGL